MSWLARKRRGDGFPFPVVVVSFSRTDALDALLRGLLAQRPTLDPSLVTVIQDGAINPFSKEKKITLEQSDAVYRTALAHLPATQILRQEHNVGIAGIYRLAYEHVFETLGADYAAIFEDDFLPGPLYFDALMRLRQLMEEHPRIAVANALGHIYPGRPITDGPIVEQHHLWGPLVAKRYWQTVRPKLQGYFDIISGVDYNHRPHDRLLDWYRSQGLGYAHTSFDAASSAMAATSGLVRVNTRKAFGSLQPVTGTHMTVDELATFRQPEPGTAADIAGLDIGEEDLERIAAEQLHHVRHDRVLTPEALRSLASVGVRWERRIAGPEEVRWAYRILLGREPGEAEVDSQVAERRSLAELRSMILASSEYRGKNG